MSFDYYYTIEKPAVAEFKDQGSKFIAYAFPIRDSPDFKKRLQGLKDEHPRATHHCFAYRRGTDGNNFRSSDDGEPAVRQANPYLAKSIAKS
jgi:putative IMPACT (imprinted ancient) family translation regulator